MSNRSTNTFWLPTAIYYSQYMRRSMKTDYIIAYPMADSVICNILYLAIAISRYILCKVPCWCKIISYSYLHILPHVSRPAYHRDQIFLSKYSVDFIYNHKIISWLEESIDIILLVLSWASWYCKEKTKKEDYYHAKR